MVPNKLEPGWFLTQFFLLPVIPGVSVFLEVIYKNILTYTLLGPWAGAGEVPHDGESELICSF